MGMRFYQFPAQIAATDNIHIKISGVSNESNSIIDIFTSFSPKRYLKKEEKETEQ